MAAMIVRARIYDGAPCLQYPFNRPSTPVRGPFTRHRGAIQANPDGDGVVHTAGQSALGSRRIVNPITSSGRSLRLSTAVR